MLSGAEFEVHSTLNTQNTQHSAPSVCPRYLRYTTKTTKTCARGKLFFSVGQRTAHNHLFIVPGSTLSYSLSLISHKTPMLSFLEGLSWFMYHDLQPLKFTVFLIPSQTPLLLGPDSVAQS